MEMMLKQMEDCMNRVEALNDKINRLTLLAVRKAKA